MCRWCESTLEGRPKTSVFCDRQCKALWERQQRRERAVAGLQKPYEKRRAKGDRGPRECWVSICTNIFTPSDPRLKVCSDCKASKNDRKERNLLFSFKMTLKDFDNIFAQQDYRCAVCKTDVSLGKGWHVDHDHNCCFGNKPTCGQCIRGIVCHHCNVGMGMFKESVEILKLAQEYLTANQRKEVKNLC